MYQLSHQVNNKPLFIALGVAFVLHFLFTLTYRIDSEWTTPKPKVLSITLVPPLTKTVAVEASPSNAMRDKPTPVTIKQNTIKQNTIKPKPIDNAVATAKKPKTDYLSREQWVIVQKLSSKELVQKIFIDLPPGIPQLALSRNSFGLQDNIEYSAITCTNGVKNYVFIHCPVDKLNLATLVVEKNTHTVTPILRLSTATITPVSLSLPVNSHWPDEFERPSENWANLAGLPTLKIPIY